MWATSSEPNETTKTVHVIFAAMSSAGINGDTPCLSYRVSQIYMPSEAEWRGGILSSQTDGLEFETCSMRVLSTGVQHYCLVSGVVIGFRKRFTSARVI